MDAFQQWLSLQRLSVADLPRCGDFPAVYALRDSKTGDILKFGKTGQLRKRIFGNYLGGVGGVTTERIHAELFENRMVDRVEIAWIETENDADALEKEKQFRTAYKQQKGRRPSWDRQG